MSVFKYLLWTTRVDKILEKVQTGNLVLFHRGLFIHHAVYVGRGRAVHHHLGPVDGEVIEVPLEYLAKGDLMKVVEVVDTPFTAQEIASRARNSIGPLPYSLPDGNCEHFTSWVYHDVWESSQLSGLCENELRLLRTVRHSQSGDGVKPSHLQNREQQLPEQLHVDQQRKHSSSLQEDLLQRPEPHRLLMQLQHHQAQVAAREIPPGQGERGDDKNHNKRSAKYDMYFCDTNFDEEDDGYVFIPPRPLKYRHTENPARIACHHARSWLKVLALQSIICLAAVPLYKCSLQAENIRRLGRQLTARRHQGRQKNVKSSEAAVDIDPFA